MSLIRPLLNTWLRRVERPFLEKAQDPEKIRERLNLLARLLFHAPRSTQTRTCQIGGQPGLKIRRKRASDKRLVLFFHGGAYVFGNPGTHSAMLARLCAETKCRAILQDYSKAPETPFPASVTDAVAAWLDLMESGEDPRQIVIGGDSAGGGLALALLAEILEKGYPIPAGVFAFSPLTDLTFSGASIADNASRDAILPANRIPDMAELYLGEQSPKDPRASPLFADFNGSPPIWLVASTSEILLDDTTRLAQKMSSQGVDVASRIEHNLPHVWPLFHNCLPEARSTLRQLATWITQQTNRTGGS